MTIDVATIPAGTWTLDPTHSDITFSVRHLAISKVRQADRDGHLKTSDFFLIEEFPTMDFASTAVRLEDDVFFVDGNLTLRGVTKAVTLKGELGGVMVDGYGQTKLGASASTKINRLDYGVNWNAALEAGGLTLGNDVTINFEIQVVLQP
jgi:polyisoprenoid-binding protein YceI